MVINHHHHHLFLKRPSFHAQLGSDVPPEMKPLHISLNTAHSGCKPSAFISSFKHSYQVFSLYPHISPLPPPHFYRPTPNHSHCYVPHAQTISIYLTPPPHRRSVHPENCTDPQFHTSFPILLRHSAHPSHHHPAAWVRILSGG